MYGTPHAKVLSCLVKRASSNGYYWSGGSRGGPQDRKLVANKGSSRVTAARRPRVTSSSGVIPRDHMWVEQSSGEHFDYSEGRSKHVVSFGLRIIDSYPSEIDTPRLTGVTCPTSGDELVT